MYNEVNIQIPSLNQPITFYIGKNATGNFQIIDNSKPQDIWFHISEDSSPHVIASIPSDLPKPLNKKQKHQIIKQGAVLTKSKSRQKSENSVHIIYTTMNNIEKSTPVGTVIIKNTQNIHTITI